MKEVDIKDYLGSTALHYAVRTSSTNIAKILLASGANVNMMASEGDTPLMKAIIFNKPHSVKLLLRFGAEPMISNMVYHNNYNNVI